MFPRIARWCVAVGFAAAVVAGLTADKSDSASEEIKAAPGAIKIADPIGNPA